MASISYDFSAGKPSGMVDAGQTGTSGVSNGVLLEGAIAGGLPNGLYNGVALHPSPVSSSRYTATATVGGSGQYYSDQGVAIGFDAAGANGLLFMMGINNTFAPTVQVITKVADVFTTVYSDSNTNLNSLLNPILSVTITYNGSSYVYTCYLNGTAVPGASWIDVNNALGAPGNFWGAALQSINNGGQYKTNGVSAISAVDTPVTAPVATRGGFFPFFST